MTLNVTFEYDYVLRKVNDIGLYRGFLECHHWHFHNHTIMAWLIVSTEKNWVCNCIQMEFEITEKWNSWFSQKLIFSFWNFRVPLNSNPIPTWHKLYSHQASVASGIAALKDDTKPFRQWSLNANVKIQMDLRPIPSGNTDARCE